MEKPDLIENIILENFNNIDMIGIAKDFCLYNIDNSPKLASLISLFDVVLESQKRMAEALDKIS